MSKPDIKLGFGRFYFYFPLLCCKINEVFVIWKNKCSIEMFIVQMCIIYMYHNKNLICFKLKAATDREVQKSYQTKS